MSWILGCYCERPNPAAIAACADLHERSRNAFRDEHVYLACGGHELTALSGRHEAGDPWVVAGLGFMVSAQRCRVMGHAEWSAVFSGEAPLSDVEGGYVAASRTEGGVTLHTDPLGLRPLYFAGGDGTYFFSTRLDWLGRLSRRKELDIESLAGYLLLEHSFSGACPINGITRLGAGARGRLERGDLYVQQEPWSPSRAAVPDEPENVLTSLLRISRADDPALVPALRLDGGIDSRVLLALGDESMRLHLAPNASSADARVAHRLGKTLARTVYTPTREVPPADQVWDLAFDRAAWSLPVAPASSVLKELCDSWSGDSITIHDIFGAIGRRGYLDIAPDADRSGRHSILDADAVLNHVRRVRHNFFSMDVSTPLQRAAPREVADALDDLPDVEGWTAADRLDLCAIRTRVPNLCAHVNSRADAMSARVQPYATRIFLTAMFGVPTRQRAGGRLYRRLIREIRESLAKPSLVEDGVSAPFRMKPELADRWRSMKPQLRLSHQERVSHDFLHRCRFQVSDLVSSRTVAECGYYEMRTLRETIEQYYRGERRHGKSIDWWISFELWRQRVTGQR